MKLPFKSTLAALAAVMLTTPAVAAPEVTLRFQHYISAKGNVPTGFMEPWIEKVEKESGGRIKIELYPAMQLGGKPTALYDQIRDGVIDGGWAVPAYTPGRFPEVEALELPFMTLMTAEGSAKAAWEFAEKNLSRRFSDIHLLAAHVHGPGVIHKKGGPINSLDDLKGLKMRTPSRMGGKLLSEIGAVPVGMPVPAFPEALANGVIDGGLLPWEIVPGLKVHELTDSHNEVSGDRSIYNLYFIWAMNKDRYEALPDDLKAVIDANSGLETSAWIGRVVDQSDKLGRQIAVERGNTLHIMDEETSAALQETGEALTQDWIDEVTARGLDGAALVRDAQQMMAKYAPQ
ncbi:MAG: C4-dicarboxylate ABC transporter [Rhodobacterales bacterium]|nr:MAG: C4-dicarboxylate ABC transporter [Rhodobacterales bacterium]